MITHEVKCASCGANYYDVTEVEKNVGDKAPPCQKCKKDTVSISIAGLTKY